MPSNKPFLLNINKRAYSAKGEKIYYSLITNILSKLDSSFSNKGFIANEITQPYIGEFVSSVFVSKHTKTPFISKVDPSITGGVVSKYLKEKMDELNIYTRSLLYSLKHNDKKKKGKNHERFLL